MPTLRLTTYEAYAEACYRYHLVLLLIHAALNYEGMRPLATNECGLKVIVLLSTNEKTLCWLTYADAC